MGIQDILKAAKGGSSNTSPVIPQGGGYSQGDVKIAASMAKRMSQIEKLVKSSNVHWAKMGEARPLVQAQKSMEEYNVAQQEHNALMRSSTASMKEKVAAYSKLATARKKAIDDTKEYNKVLNETKGVSGRALNVLRELPLGMMALAGAANAVKIALGQANEGFQAMARNGQVAGKSMGDLAKSTGMFVVEMNLASISAAKFGIAPEESNKAFAQLTETFGGTGKAVNTLGAQWESLSQIAAVSGIGMTAMSNLVSDNFRKVGGTMEQALDAAKNQVADLSMVTAELNARFGAGSVNTAAFADAINNLAFGSSFANQNSRMLTETLGRELQMQLALGKAPEAAMKAATKNIELAGKVNIVGITQFREKLQAAYEEAQKEGTGAEYLESLGEKFGSQGEIIGNMLETKTLMDSKNLFAFQEAVDQSTGLRDQMLDDMRSSAAGGDVSALLAKGLGIREAQYMVAEADLLNTKIGKLTKTGKEGAAAAEDLFGKDWQKGEDKEKVEKFIAAQASGDFSKAEMQMKFREMPGAKLPDAEVPEDAARKPWEEFVGNTEGAGWFSGITSAFKTIPGLLNTAVGSIVGGIGGAIALWGAKSIAAKMMGGVGVPGMGGVAGMGAKLLKGGLVTAAAGVGVAGFADAASRMREKKESGESFLGMEEDEGGLMGSRAGGALQATASGALVGAAIGSVIPVVGTLIGAAVGAGFGALGALIADTTADAPTAPEAALLEKAQQEADAVPPPSSPVPVSDEPVGAGAKSGGPGAAIATGTVSGNSLILEVTNWDQIHAQAVDAAASG
ncbi:hypothetical protein LCGC14_0487510 [marine sediment metagenome]|uniref:Uncharacterized protein n=1 Tax=marine sediment metagenome TaxID=412755 RepID=A0A0F9UUJ3_9ZZZZ